MTKPTVKRSKKPATSRQTKKKRSPAKKVAKKDRSDSGSLCFKGKVVHASAEKIRASFSSALDGLEPGDVLPLDVSGLKGGDGSELRLTAGLLVSARARGVSVDLMPQGMKETFPWSLFGEEWK